MYFYFRYEFTSSYQQGPDTHLLPSKDTGLSLRMAEYSRRSGSKAPVKTYRSKRGMRERRDLRSLDKEDDEERMFKAPSRRRVYELKAIADTAGPEQGMTACGSHGDDQFHHGYMDCCCCVREVTNAKICTEPLHKLNSFDEHEDESATDLHEMFVDTAFCENTKDNHCNEQNQKERDRIDENTTSDTDIEMHAAQDVAFENSDFSCDKLSELLESFKITCDMNSPDVAIKTVNSDTVKSLTVELPCKKGIIDKNIPSEKGYSEASTSYVMYFSEGDWCRSLESPPEDEEGMSGGVSSQQEEEKKHGGGGGGSSRSRGHSDSSPHRCSGRGGSGGGGSSFNSGSSHGGSTRQSRSESRSVERGRTMSPGSLTGQLSSIPESRMEGDGDDTEKMTKDSVEKKPSSSGKVGNFQGHVATMMMQGGRDENQNKTSWKSVLQTNLNERIDTVGTKEAGSGAAKDSQKMGFNMMQVKIIFPTFSLMAVICIAKVCLHVTFSSLSVITTVIKCIPFIVIGIMEGKWVHHPYYPLFTPE